MEPKLKAQDLVNSFAKLPEEGSLMWHLSFEIAKQCALIAVDEIHEALKQTFHQLHKKTDMTPDLYLSESIAVHYYQEVKKEIDKL